MVRETRREPRSLPSVHLIGIDVMLLSANGGQLGVNSVPAYAVLREGRRRRDGRVRFVVVREKGDVHDVHAFVAPVREKGDAGGGGDASAELRWIKSTCSRAVRRTLFTGPSSFAFPFLRRP